MSHCDNTHYIVSQLGNMSREGNAKAESTQRTRQNCIVLALTVHLCSNCPTTVEPPGFFIEFLHERKGNTL